MLRVVVDNPAFPFVSRKGETFKVQDIFVYLISPETLTEDRYPTKQRIFLDSESKGHAPGEYTLHPCSVYSAASGGLQFGRLTLTPLVGAPKPPK